MCSRRVYQRGEAEGCSRGGKREEGASKRLKSEKPNQRFGNNIQMSILVFRLYVSDIHMFPLSLCCMCIRYFSVVVTDVRVVLDPR